MTVGIVIAVLMTVGAVAYIMHLFVRDHRISSRGRRIRARVDEVRHIAKSDSGVVTVRYRLSWSEDGVIRRAEGTETILAKRVPGVQPGRDVDIMYLDDDHIRFEFD